MRGLLLARMRNADGRSLARALAVLLFVNALIAGWHAGFMAEAGPGTVICAYGAEHGPAGSPAMPHPGDEPLCCLVACHVGGNRSPAAGTPTAAIAVLPERTVLAAAPPSRNLALPRALAVAAFEPRGPPLLA
jgi:hypothetical protein